MGTGGAALPVWSEHSSGGGKARFLSELSKGPFAVRSIVGWGILLYPLIGVYYYYLYDEVLSQTEVKLCKLQA